MPLLLHHESNVAMNQTDTPRDLERPSFERRRLPTTSKSQATVAQILKATQELLADKGFSRITTNEVARRAGVNISSLYQYFSSMESVALALFEQVASENSELMRENVLRHLEHDIDIAMPKMIRALVRLYRDNQTVLLRLPDELPELRALSPAQDIRNVVVSIGRLYIEQQRPDLNSRKREIAYQFLSNSTLANIRNYLLLAPPFISETAFVGELSRSIVAYIRAI